MIGNRRVRRNRSMFRRESNPFTGRPRGGSIFFRLLLLAVVVIAAWFYLRDLSAPVLSGLPTSGPVGGKQELVLRLDDPGTGLRQVQVAAVQGGKQVVLIDKTYAPGSRQAEERISLDKRGLVDGPFALVIAARDHAYFPLLQGNRLEQRLSLELDSKPPTLTVQSGTTNFNQGGAGLVVFTASEELGSAGIRVGDHFFPAFRQPSGNYLCLLAFPWNLPAAVFVPKIVASDRAGNERITGIYFHTNAKKFPTDKIQVTQAFLDNKIVPDFQHYFPETTDPGALFLRVNRELRGQNLQTILEHGRQTAATPLWQGTFQRLPKAAVPGYFAQTRTYIMGGRAVDQQTHLGIDLASTAQAPVPAANSGKVIFAGELGIYGECIIIDHGLNLQTLYGHLSQIDVSEGATVQKGETIGRTGTSGLAGGDHLHFDVLVAGRQVNPLEWWDATWLENNIVGKLRLAGLP